MTFWTEGVVPWNSLDDNTRGPLASELESGYPCGEADQQLFNWTAGYPIGQIWNAIASGGITPSTNDLLELARAIQSQKFIFAAAGGTANALTAALSPALLAYTDGLVVRLRCPSANTGAVTVNVSGLGAKQLRTMRGTQLVGDDIPAGADIQAIYDATAGHFRLMHVVPSDIAAQIGISKSPFNIQMQSNGTRTTLAGTGFVNFTTGSYVKKSATSNVLVRASTNLYWNSGVAAGQMRITLGAQTFTVICANMTNVANQPAPNGSTIMSGLAAGPLSWRIDFGRTDGSAWNSVINPSSTDTSNLPPAGTNTTLEFMEFEP